MIIKVNYTVSNPIIKITYDETPIYVSTTSNPIYVSVNYGTGGGGSGTVTSVGLTMPSAFTVTSSPITISGTIAVTGSGTTSQYVRGDGTLATFPSLTVYVPYTGALSTVNLGANNIYANAFYNSFTNITASGTQVVLTVNSAPEILVNGSGGQTIKLPDATTLSSGTIYSINNNQSSGAVLVNNNSNTLIVSIPSGGYAEVILIDNSIAAGTWDRHFQAPSNVSWSTNTFDYVGSITGATWNGSTVQPNRGGTGQSTYTDGQLLIGNSTGNTLSKSTLTAGTGISITNGSGTITITNTSPSSGGTVTSVAALTLGITGTDLSSTVATGTTTPVITLNVPTASASNRGVLSSTDWSTFNGKFTLPSLTSGSVLFSNGTTISQNNANFFWDDAGGRLGIGTVSPLFGIHCTSSIRGNALFSSTNLTVGGTTAATTSSIVDIISTTKGVLFPRMTTTQKNAIATPATGLVVFDTTLAKLCVYGGSAWQTITSV
jgi:hypothetical protein